MQSGYERRQRFLVTGGAGFIGSHLVLALRDRGHDVVVLDSLLQGHAAAVPPGTKLVVGDIGDQALAGALLADGPWDGVFHFAAHSLVGESMRAPFLYFQENTAKSLRFIETCVRHGVRRFVLSSTANVYGDAASVPIRENAPVRPSSPYGESKLMIEQALAWADRIHGLRSACLRYFNAAGADPEGRAGEDHDPETHLIPLVIDAALGRRPELAVFGDDWPTPDGTCIRDYIHVTDLAEAHLLALRRIEEGSVVWNLGTGGGTSVREVVRAVERISGRPVPFRVAGRRAGDPAALVAAADRVRQETGWVPRLSGIDDIVRTALAWRLAHPCGYGTAGEPGRSEAGGKRPGMRPAA